jgi:tetratricopeptide (TPR) repeat protein
MSGKGERKAIIAVLLLVLLSACVSQTAKEELAQEYYNLGNAFYEIRSYDRAIDYYTLAISHNPGLLNAHYNLSLALIKQGRGDRAEETLLALLEEEPDNTSVLKILSYAYYKQGKTDEALDSIDRVLEITPDDSDTLYNKATILWKAERREAAEAVFAQLLSSIQAAAGGLYTDALFSRAALLLELERLEEAASELERYLEWDPADMEANRMLADLYLKLQRYDRALDAHSRILEMDENLPEIWFAQARILLTRIEDPFKGLKALEEALLRGFENAEELDALSEDPDLIEKDEVDGLISRYRGSAETE